MPDKKRILVVEDEMIVAHSICAGLERMNYAAVGPAGNAADAIRIALEEKPDLILMDIHLGNQADGIEAAQEILKKHIIPIVYVTAHSDLHTIDRAKATGPYGYIHKPFSENEIRSAIEMALYKHEKQLEINRSERLLSTTLKNIGDAVIATDRDLTITYANPVAEKLLGAGSEELPGRRFQDVMQLIAERDMQPVALPGQELMERSGRWYLPEECLLSVGKDGHIPVNGSLAAIRNDQDKVTGIVAVLRDIRRERKHARTTRIRKQFETVINEIRNRLIRDVPPDITAILGLMARSVQATRACLCVCPSGNGNPDGNDERISWVSAEDAGISGHTNSCSHLCGNWWKEQAGDGEPLLFASIDTLPDGAAAEREAMKREGVGSVALFPFQSKETGYVGTVSVYWPETREKFPELEIHTLSIMVELVSAFIVRARAEAMLRSSEIRFRTLIQKSSDVITVINRDGEFIYVAPSVKKALGYPEEELHGKSVFDYIHKDDIAEMRNAFRKMLDNSVDEMTVECRFQGKDGKWIHLESIGTNLAGEPSIAGVVINSRDISDRKQFQEELIRAKDTAEAMSRVKTALLANMSHEMRTPLTGILGFANILESELPDGEFRDMASRISASGQRLMETIESVLDLVKLEADRVRVQPERTNIVDEVIRNVNLHVRPARHKDLGLEVRCDMDELFVDIDRQLFGRILYNLLSNAIKYTDVGHVEVLIATERDLLDEWVLVHVKDTGIGISTEFLPRVFDEFQQESSGYSRKYEGTGLGLTISRKLARILGGSISVKSKKGEGSIFTVRLPLKTSDGPVQVRPDYEVHQPSRQPSGEAPRVLVVEDDFDSSEVAKVYLGAFYDVVIVDSGEKAMDELKKSAFDLVLLDISLGPGMDGVKTLKAIRKDAASKSVPVIALTAHALRGDADYYLSQGFSAYMPKPYKKKDLLTVVANYLRE